jgi:hypothetical protein
LERLRKPKSYKLHLAVDAVSELPLACIADPANENEKKHASRLLDKALKAAGGRVFIADPLELKAQNMHVKPWNKTCYTLSFKPKAHGRGVLTR